MRNLPVPDCFDVMLNPRRMTRGEIAEFQAAFNVNLHADQIEDDAYLDGETDELAGLPEIDDEEFITSYVFND